MDKKAIQEQRMRRYFIEATREILKGEGFKAISVRNIADRAGYSYATLYNYFKDIRDLVFECVLDFQQECQAFVEERAGAVVGDKERILARMMAYGNYFLEYPGVFDLFYLEKYNGIEGRLSTSRIIFDFPAQLCAADWQNGVAAGTWTEQEASRMQTQLSYLAAGLLVFYLNRRIPMDYPEFQRLMKEQFLSALDG